MMTQYSIRTQQLVSSFARSKRRAHRLELRSRADRFGKFVKLSKGSA